MLTIKIFGTTPPCFKCKEMEKRAVNVAKNYSDQVTVAKFDAISDEGLKYGVMMTPTVAIDEKVISVGKVISETELEKALKKELEELS